MATIVLSAVGAAVGGLSSGTFLGMTGAVIGRAVGATLGRVIDQRLMGNGSDVIEQGQVDRFRLSGASEGTPVARLFGRMRLGGQVIWASQFTEHVSTTGGGGSGKGTPRPPKIRTYSYSVNLALALCEGEIARVGRVWADGVQIARDEITMRVYRGTAEQMPDPKMEAVEGAGSVPAYRGLAYVVIEDLDLAPFGNRVPQLSFEVVRPAQPAFLDSAPVPSEAVRAVALMPGTGEYALATTPVNYWQGIGLRQSANVNTPSGQTDFATALADLRGEMPNVGSVSLIVSWFGDDLRAGQCQVRPKVEQKMSDGEEMPWRVSGLSRENAQVIAKLDGRAVYGGTPADAAVIEAIGAIREGGQEVMFYPFLLMEILAGNGLPDPWADSGEQAALPWRGRITGEKAPGLAGSPDGTAAAEAEVDAFFGTAQAWHFLVIGGSVTYFGPPEWSYRRFILHCAALCKAAGGVESFCIGSEMRSLTRLRGAQGFPAVAALRALAGEVRQLLPDAELSYAADWSEYFGYQPADGSGDVFYNLDPLWADDEIDFIGIDNYLPLSDWRDGPDHADADWGSIHNIDYLQANIEGGEGYDWYYGSSEGREAQIRLPITDGAGGTPWIYRVKDIRNWWANPHEDRMGPLSRSLLGDGTSPRDWATSGDVVLTPDDSHADWPGAVQVTGGPGGLSWHNRIAAMSYFGAAGRLYRGRLWVRRGSSDQVLVYQIHNKGQGWVKLQYDFDTDIWWADPDDHELISHGIENFDDGTSLITFDYRFLTQDETVFFNAGPRSNVSGDITILGASVQDLEAVKSPWVPKSKPIRFTEIGCAAVDKGTNQPNKFLDPKSAESALPYYSNGQRDDLIQTQYLRALIGYWSDPANNPVSELYGGPMIDMSRAHVWAWDARPWPAFPNNPELWSDGENHARGHWITGRMAAQPLAEVVAEICEDAGVRAYDVSQLHGFVRGAVSGQVESARARLQPLMLAHGIEAVERDGTLVFRSRLALPDGTVAQACMAADDSGAAAPAFSRLPEAETTGRVRVAHVEADGAFETRVAEAVFPGDASDALSQSDLPLVLTRAEGRAIAERWLAEARVARDQVSFILPPSRRDLGAGSVVGFEDGSTWRIDRMEDAGARQVVAVRSEAEIYRRSDAAEEPVAQEPFLPPVPVSPVFLDLPLLTGAEVAHAPHLAVAADPWPGAVAVYGSASEDGYALNRLIDSPAGIGTLETPLFSAVPGAWDRGKALRVRLSGRSLASADPEAVLNGANRAAIGSGDGGDWEVIQFAEATLVAPDLWDISLRLRGQAGSDGIMPGDWPVGSLFVLLDGGPQQIEMALAERGLARHYRVGPATRGYDDASYVHRHLGFAGAGLRPYAPCHLRVRRVGTALEFGWIRRSRIDGDSWQGTEVPLGEADERYLLRLLDGTAIRREVELTAPAYSYSDAARAADGLSAPFTAEVAQISESYGPGPFTRIEIND